MRRKNAAGGFAPNHKMRLFQAGCLAAALCLAGGTTAFAGSPEFAYTAEEWAMIRDNKLEFGEISKLIHEYNNTVIKNQLEYEDYRGDTKDDIADDYYDAANEIYDRLEYPDVDSSNYASALSSYLSSQIQAENLVEQGDNNVDDGTSKKLGYDKTEAELVKQAEQQMISYWSQTYSLDSMKVNEEQAQASYDSVLVKQSAGMSTQAQVLSAKEAVDSAAASLLSAQSKLAQTKENLCLMLGWTYGADVEICEVPDPDMDYISSINLEEDVKTGVESNYSLKILERQASNARNTYNKASLEQSLKSGKETVSANIKSAYEELMIAKSNYEQALDTLSNQSEKMAAAERKQSIGTINKNDYIQQKCSYTQAEVSAKTTKLSLLTAQRQYEWAVNGLAATS